MTEKHQHCNHTPEKHEEMGWSCDLWPVGGPCCGVTKTCVLCSEFVNLDLVSYAVVETPKGHRFEIHTACAEELPQRRADWVVVEKIQKENP